MAVAGDRDARPRRHDRRRPRGRRRGCARRGAAARGRPGSATVSRSRVDGDLQRRRRRRRRRPRRPACAPRPTPSRRLPSRRRRAPSRPGGRGSRGRPRPAPRWRRRRARWVAAKRPSRPIGPSAAVATLPVLTVLSFNRLQFHNLTSCTRYNNKECRAAQQRAEESPQPRGGGADRAPLPRPLRSHPAADPRSPPQQRGGLGRGDRRDARRLAAERLQAPLGASRRGLRRPPQARHQLALPDRRPRSARTLRRRLRGIETQLADLEAVFST